MPGLPVNGRSTSNVPADPCVLRDIALVGGGKLQGIAVAVMSLISTQAIAVLFAVVTFPSAVTFDSAAVTSGTGTISSIDGSGTTALTVNLTGVTNAQTITVSLTNVNDSAGNSSSLLFASMDVLVGDSRTIELSATPTWPRSKLR